MARNKPGSPVIFSNHGSPVKDFVESPQTRQLVTLQKQLEEKNIQARNLRSDLENEKAAKADLVVSVAGNGSTDVLSETHGISP